MPAPAHLLEPAFAAFRAADYARVEQLSRPQLALTPDDPNLLTLMAISLHQLGRTEEALGFYRHLADVDPASPEHWSNLGTVLRECRRPEDAESAYLRAIRLAPDNPQYRVDLGLLLGETGNVAGARTALLDAFDLDPRSLEARIYGSLACFECGDARNAERLLEGHAQWRAHLPLDPLLDLGRALLQLGHERDSEDVLTRAKALAPTDPMVVVREVLMHERLNRLDDARAAAATLPAPESLTDPELATEIINAHATLAARAEPARARTLLEGLLARDGNNPQGRASIGFSLAKVCDAVGDTAAAMSALRAAHDAQVESARTLVPEMLEPGAEPLKTTSIRVTPEQFAHWPRGDGPAEADSPVFIMGFPRSGTTLLEQMLDAHPQYQSMDERAFLQAVIERMERLGLRHPQQLGDLAPDQLDALRDLYWQLVGTAIHREPGRRLVDKNPLNMLRLPLVCRLFPRAPIILALRHPCDVLLSCYMQNFRSPSFMVLCSTLERLARSYVNAMEFWLHHERLLGPRVFLLRYEAMLDDVEGHVDQLGEFLGIDNARSMLGYQARARDKGFISTPSYAQVVEPINKKAVGRWKRYEPYFAGALPILRPIMEHWGYDA